MKKLIRIPKILLLFGFLVLALLLSGCVKKSDATYFLRGLANSYQITYQEGDSSSFISSDIGLSKQFRGADIKWESSHPEIITTNGVVNLPEDDTKVELTATFSVDDTKVSNKLVVNVVSKESIQNYFYNNANNLVLFLETRNNDINYANAKAAFDLVDYEHKDFNDLQQRFLTQQTIRELDHDLRNLEANLNSINYDAYIAKLNTVPQTNNYVVGYKSRVNILTDHVNVGNQVFALLDDKTETNYDNILPLVTAIPSHIAARKPMMDKLASVREYLDHIDALTNQTVTQEELEDIVLLDLASTTITSAEYQALYSLYETNQTLLNDADPDRLTYISEKLDILESSFTPENLLISTLLIENYSDDKLDELMARLQIIILINIVNEDNLSNALNANELVESAAVKLQNSAIISDYAKVVLLNEVLEDLYVSTFVDYNSETIISLVEDAFVIKDTLELEENITYYNSSFELYNAIYATYQKADEIITAPFDRVGNEFLIINKITETKRTYTSQPISSPNNKAISDKLQAYVRSIILERTNDLVNVIEAEEESNENNRVLMGQLINQLEGNDYTVVQLKAYKETLDRQIRVKHSTSLVARIIAIFVAVVVFLVLQAMTADYASKKGYEGLVYSLIALIPIGGFIYFYKKPKRRNISKSGIQQVYKPTEIMSKVLIYGQIVFVAVIVLIPIIYIFGMAFSNMQTDIPNTIWPKEPNWNAFNFLLTETKFKQWWLNTVMIAIINMLIGTVLITGAAYVFARFSFRGKKAGLLTILVLQSFPSFMGLIAMYVLFWKFGLLGRPIYLTILYIGGGIPGNIWLIKGFMDQIPKDLDESAMIDGANKLQIFVRIIMPLAIPILTFVAVGMFMAPWMDYMLPGYLLNVPRAGMGANPDYDITQQWTLAVGLFKFINDNNSLNYSAFAAGALIVGMPITILYMFFQKYLIEGIMAGATKG